MHCRGQRVGTHERALQEPDKQKAAGCAAGEDDGHELRSIIAATPWQLRCHVIGATADVLRAVACHAHSSTPAQQREGLDAVLLLARERLLAAAVDPALRVRLAAAAALSAVFGCGSVAIKVRQCHCTELLLPPCSQQVLSDATVVYCIADMTSDPARPSR